MQSKKNDKRHLLKTENVHSLPNKKTRTGQNLFSSKYKVFKPRKYQRVVHIISKILMLPFQEGVTNYLIT